MEANDGIVERTHLTARTAQQQQQQQKNIYIYAIIVLNSRRPIRRHLTKERIPDCFEASTTIHALSPKNRYLILKPSNRSVSFAGAI